MSLKDSSQFGQATLKTHFSFLYALNSLHFHVDYGDCRRNLARIALNYHH